MILEYIGMERIVRVCSIDFRTEAGILGNMMLIGSCARPESVSSSLLGMFDRGDQLLNVSIFDADLLAELPSTIA